ncbi:MAG: ADP-ribosylglycohydrolase family protein [Leptolinea sp.]
MIGAIAGDVIGSTYEHHSQKTTEFELFTEWSKFTDDSVCTIAVAKAILTGLDLAPLLKETCLQFPHAGYGGMFKQWLYSSTLDPYNSFGNGSAMRVSPVGFAFTTEKEVLEEAKRSADVTHNHPEGVKGAQATALAIFLARQGSDKVTIRKEIESRFQYDLHRTLADIRPGYYFDVTCQGSVPESIIAFLESTSYEDCIRLAVSLGGDADTQACIAGGIAQAYYRDIPIEILDKATALLTEDMRETLTTFKERFGW